MKIISRYARKALASFLALLISTTGTFALFPALHGKAEAAPNITTATYLGSDKTTHGHWQGKYGGDGYILLGYQGPNSDMLNGTSHVDRVKIDDMVLKPSYLDDYTMPGMGGTYWTFLPSYAVMDNVLDKPDPLPPGATQVTPDKFPVISPAQSHPDSCWSEYKFALNDNAEHLFTYYSYSEMKQNTDQTLTVSTPSGDVLATAPVVTKEDAMNNGVYVTFLVKGGFTLRVTSASSFAGPSGFFFDSPVSAAATGLTASLYQQSQAQLTWTNQGSPDSILIERSKDNVNFSQVAAVGGNTASYADATVVPGDTYYYRVRYRQGTAYGAAANAAEPLAIPAYQSTKLTLQNTDMSQTVGDTVTLSAKLEQVNESGNTPLAGETVSFKLAGSHVGDGTSLGQEIPADMGSAVTDENGVATVAYTCIYGGSFQVSASFAQDDAKQLSRAASASVNLAVASVPWTSAPKIYQMSDAVAAGQTFTVNGYAIDKNAVDVAIAPDQTGGSPSTPPAGAIHPQIVQTDDSTDFVVAKMPADAVPGVYNVWVKNAYGWSTPYKMNAARALYMSDYQAYKGIDIEVVGRNFDQKEFGGATATKVRLNDGGGHTYALEIKSLNPYNVTFTVGNQPLGNYFVEVSDDNGRNWSRPSSGQKLEIVAPGKDPLGLGVAWAKDFNWDNVYDVTSPAYGAGPNDTEDDTAAIQKAADDAERNGGGVVYLPNGSYYASTIVLGAGVVLEGQDEYNTKLYYDGTGQNFITSKDTGSIGGVAQLQGLANLSLLLSDPDIRPDMMIWLGQVWGDGLAAHNEALRTANRIFVKGVNENYPITQAKNRGVGVGFIANERTLIEDCHFYGWMAAASSLMTNQYNNIKDNNFEYVFGAVQTIAKYSFLERNTITGHPELYVESHGIFTRSNTYAADNDIRNMGNDIAGNEGEGICSDSPEMRFDAGLVLKADATSITAAPNVNYPDPLIVHNGTLKVTITDGRGMGQTRAVANIDRAAHVITFDRPFDVIPDSTSKFALYTPTENLTVYRNTTHNVLNGVVIWWGGYDDVIANNNLTDSYGIYVAAALSSNFSCPSYFTRVTGNTVVGVDRLNKYSGIGVVTQRSNNGSYFGVQAYATEIRNNILIGDNTATDHRAVGMQYPPVNGIYLAAYGYGGANGNNNGTGTGDITNSIIEGNQLSNLTTGVTLTKCDSGQVVANNRYDSSVLTFLNDRSSDNTLVTGNVSGDLAPAFAQAGNQTATVGRAFSFTLHAADPENDALTYSASNLPHGAALDGATGAFSWTPARSQAGTYVVHFTVSDGTLSDGEDVTITVVDKTRLEVEIQQAGRLDGGKYTAESWTALQTALTQAGTVDSDPAATQAEADGAFHALAKAIAGLRVKAVVTGVTVSPSHPSVRTGATVDFRAAVHGTGSPSQKVTWAVSGNKSSGTSIDSAGRLTVAADETAVTLTVTATSSVDGSKSGTAAVKVKQASHSASGGRGFSLWHFLSLISFRHIWSFH